MSMLQNSPILSFLISEKLSIFSTQRCMPRRDSLGSEAPSQVASHRELWLSLSMTRTQAVFYLPTFTCPKNSTTHSAGISRADSTTVEKKKQFDCFRLYVRNVFD
jgi:hypothetical protein